MKPLIVILFVVFSIAISCTKEEATPRNYPRVETGAVRDVSEAGALFSGEITYSTVPIKDHGFVWSTVANFEPDQADVLSLGEKSETGTFTAACTYALEKGKTYYVRAYAKSGQHSVYGDAHTFMSMGSQPPQISDFSPKEATWDDEIVLTGKNLSAIKSNLHVKFGTVDAFVVQSSEHEVTVKVPYTLNQKESTIALSLAGHTSTFTEKFVLRSPVIHSVSPVAAEPGVDVTISGQWLNASAVKVYFGDLSADLKFVSKDKVICIVPSGAGPGDVQVSLRTGEGNLVDDIMFEVF